MFTETIRLIRDGQTEVGEEGGIFLRNNHLLMASNITPNHALFHP